jgi:hypothetical protein
VPINLEDEAIKAIPGFVGSLVALRWFTGNTLQALVSIFGGGVISYYGTPCLVHWFGSSHRDFNAFLLGLFGMAITAKVLETIAAIDGVKILLDLIPFRTSK